LVLQRRKPRPRLEDADRRFWGLACRSFIGWRASLLVVKPETVLRWHRNGRRPYWRRRSCRRGPRPTPPERRPLTRRPPRAHQLSGERRIQAELATAWVQSLRQNRGEV